MNSVPLLPTVNAFLNATSAILLLFGYRFIRTKNVAGHKACMLGAFATSTLFLALYLFYHWRVGSVRFQGTGAARAAYLGILLSHSVLAAAVAPMALRTLYLAWTGDFQRHAAFARKTLPVWLYVSLTGIVVFAMLYLL